MSSLSLGLGLTTLTSTKGGGAAPSYSAEALAFFARLTPAPLKPHMDAYDALYVALKSAGLLAKLDSLKLQKLGVGGAAQWARQNLVQDIYNSTPFNSPTFSVNGYTGDGVSSYLDENLDLSTASGLKFGLNRGSLYAYTPTVIGVAGPLMRNATSGPGQPRAEIYSRYTDNRPYCAVNSLEVQGSSNVADGSGHWHMLRTASNAQALYRGTSQVVADSLAPISLAAGNMRLLGPPSSSQTIAAAAIGALALADLATFNSIIDAFFATVGAL